MAHDERKPVGTSDNRRYVLCLFVTGMTPHSTQAIANLKHICEKHLAGRYELEVIDLYQQPGLARRDRIVAAPTLIKKWPYPLRRLVGNLSQTDRVLVTLDLCPWPPGREETA